MPTPARNTLAIVGAGPIGLEAALAALDRGIDVHLYEHGEVGAHPIAWGHVRMFTPWRMNVGPVAAAHLSRAGWEPPDPEACPTGLEYAESFLQRLAALPAFGGRVHTHAQVVAIGRSGLVKGDLAGDPRRREHPFRLLVRDPGGRESFAHAFSVIDASGVYGNPDWAGDGGIPARNEQYLRPGLSYWIEDVRGVARGRYAGSTTLVVGGGLPAAITVSDLASLADEAPGTGVRWVTHEPREALYPERADDPFPVRRALFARARELARGAHPAVAHLGGVRVEGFEFNSATHRYRATLMLGEEQRVEDVDRVIVHTGFGPDDSLYRELQVHACYASRAPFELSAALREAGPGGHLPPALAGARTLAHPEPDFYVLGHKSYGRHPGFLLETGFQQAAAVVEALARAQRTGAWV